MACILLIDDSRDLLGLLDTHLSAAGHRVIALTTGRGWLAVARRESVDLVLTDIYMPDCDGIEILQQAQHAGLGVPFVVMSAHTGDTNFFKLARALGAAATLAKPFTIDRLNQVVAGLLPPVTSDRRAAAASPLLS